MRNRIVLARYAGVASLLSFGLSACKQPEKVAPSEPAIVHDEPSQPQATDDWRTTVTQSPNGRFSIQVTPKRRYWLDGTRVRFLEGTSQLWCQDLPYFFSDAMVTDNGLVVGHGVRYANEDDRSKSFGEFVLAIFEPDGTSRIATRPITPRGGSTQPPMPDFPMVIRLQVDEPRDFIMLWVADANDGCGDVISSLFGVQMMYLSRLSNPQHQRKIDLQSFGTLEDALIIRDTPLVVASVVDADNEGKFTKRKLVVVDAERGPVWTHELRHEIVQFPSGDAPKPLVYLILVRDQQPEVWVRSLLPGVFQVKQEDESILTFKATRGVDQSWGVSQVQ